MTATAWLRANRTAGSGSASDDTPVALCDDVSRVFGAGPAAVVAVHGTSCIVRPGDRIAVTGSSGSGKSTLLHLLAGLEKPNSGTVSWPGLDATGGLRVHVGVVFQSPSLIGSLTAVENCLVPLHLLGRADPRSQAESALASLGLLNLADRLPQELSGGQAQRVALARVLAQNPRLVLADEPTGQLDRATGQHVMDVLLETVDRLGAALVVSTHDEAVAARLRTRWRMRDGRLQRSHDELEDHGRVSGTGREGSRPC